MDTEPNPDAPIDDDATYEDIAALVRARLTPEELRIRRTYIMAIIDLQRRTPQIRIH